MSIPETASLPTEVGRYRIEAILGRGAMGVIYRAHDPEIDRRVALKLLRADLLEGQDRADFLERFRREAQAAGRCTHPNIVAIYDFAMHQGDPFIAMEYVEGVSLSQALMQGTRFAPAEAAYVILQVLDALSCAHGMGIVHRDIKPANIMLLAGGRVKVADFGISRITSSELTQMGAMIGTPSYMSPEQCRGAEVDARSDLFSAAAVFYELLSGQRPFPGRDVHEIVARLLNDKPPDIGAIVPSLPSGLPPFMDRALAREPAQRFASASTMATALRAAMQAAAPMPPDATVPVRPALVDPGTATIDPALLGRIERRLAQHVGPIARYLVQNSARRFISADALCRALAQNIENAADRARFLEAALRDSPTVAPGLPGEPTLPGTTPTAAAALPEMELERVQRELARHIGPIARLLVRRAAARATSLPELWTTLGAHIDDPAARGAFLARRTG